MLELRIRIKEEQQRSQNSLRLPNYGAGMCNSTQTTKIPLTRRITRRIFHPLDFSAAEHRTPRLRARKRAGLGNEVFAGLGGLAGRSAPVPKSAGVVAHAGL